MLDSLLAIINFTANLNRPPVSVTCLVRSREKESGSDTDYLRPCQYILPQWGRHRCRARTDPCLDPDAAVTTHLATDQFDLQRHIFPWRRDAPVTIASS